MSTTSRLSLKRRMGWILKSLVPASAYHKCCKATDSVVTVARAIGHLGWQRQCPFCGLRWRRFLPEKPIFDSPLYEKEHVVGGGPVAESLCPACGSSERHRHVYLYLREMTDLFDRSVRVLHVAPERRLAPILERRANITYVSADLCSPLALVQMDITRMPFASASFDVVICNHVLEHVPADRRAMSEILRVLTPGGWALLQVPIAVTRAQTESDPSVTSDEERRRRFGQRDHVRIYGRDYPAILEEAGFRVERRSVTRQFGRECALRWGILPEEDLFIAFKTESPPQVPTGLSV